MNHYLGLVVLIICTMLTQRVAYADTGADILMGEKLYVKCIACHAPAYHRTGPKHCGLLGRNAGSADGFAFTSSMKLSGITWTTETLDEFLQAPLEMVPGSSMGFAGIPSVEERQQLVAFLASLTDKNPLCR